MSQPKPQQPEAFRYGGAAGGPKAVLATAQAALAKTGPLRGASVLLAVNKKHGFDCPGCAWPDPEHRSPAEFCENGAKAVLDEADSRRVGPEFFARHSVTELSLQSDRWLNAQGRLTHPVLLEAGASHYVPVSWEEAFSVLARELKALPSPNEAVFYTSGRTSNEAAFLYQLFARQLGTNNLPDCSNMCHESSGYALEESIGVGKGTVQLEDFKHADVILIFGQNPGSNHPRMLTTLQEAARRGARIVAVNPLAEPGLLRFKHPQELAQLLGPGTPLATLHLPVRINGDVALIRGLIKEVLAAEERAPGRVLDHEFIAAHTSGIEELIQASRATSWSEIERSSGLTRAAISEAAEILIDARSVIACWAMGLTQHENGVANVQELVNLLLLRGNIGRPGAGLCPVRGHSNVQGDRTMGIIERPSAEFLSRLGARFMFEPPTAHGLDTIAAIEAMRDGRARVFFGMGGNFVAASPDTELTARALTQCSLTAHVSTKLNRSHLTPGRRALILPCLGRTDRDEHDGEARFVSVEDSMGVVHASRGLLSPPSSELLSEPAIVCRLARATLGTRSSVDWEALEADYNLIRDHIEAVVPGFHDYNRRVREASGFVLPNAASRRRFATQTGRARFIAHPLPAEPLSDGEWLMMTLRSHDQFNTTVYTDNDRYRGVRGNRRVVFMRPDELAAAGLEPSELVDLTSHHRGVQRLARGFEVRPLELPRRCVATYFPEANCLVPIDQFAHGSRTPASKSVRVTVAKASPPTS